MAKVLARPAGPASAVRRCAVLHRLARVRQRLGDACSGLGRADSGHLVGLTTVPHLARRVAVKTLRDAVDYEVTRAGIIYVIATLLIGIAALTTGTNLRYSVVAAMLAAILVSGIVSALVLRDLQLDVRLPEHVFAGRPVLGRILLRNPRTRLPSFSIHVVPSKRKKAVSQWLWEPATFGFPPKRPPEQQWVRLPDRRVRRIVHDGSTPGIF